MNLQLHLGICRAETLDDGWQYVLGLSMCGTDAQYSGSLVDVFLADLLNVADVAQSTVGILQNLFTDLCQPNHPFPMTLQ